MAKRIILKINIHLKVTMVEVGGRQDISVIRRALLQLSLVALVILWIPCMELSWSLPSPRLPAFLHKQLGGSLYPESTQKCICFFQGTQKLLICTLGAGWGYPPESTGTSTQGKEYGL